MLEIGADYNSGDAPAEPPAADGLAEEARELRLLPGKGALPLAEIVAAYPKLRPIEAEGSDRSRVSAARRAPTRAADRQRDARSLGALPTRQP
jgi:hypothetical protein